MARTVTASVIVPARNAQRTLGRTLAALAQQDIEQEYEVIVIDDGSTDGTAEVARAVRGPMMVLTQSGAGQASARNHGVAHARGAALAFCDADVFPTAGWLRAGLHALMSADLVQGKVLPDPQARLGPFDRTIWITSKVGLWESANLFVTRQLFEQVGGFGEGLRPRRGKPLAEDVLFGYNALRAGARSAYCPDALAYHAVFHRDWRGYVAERQRLVYFPAIARAAPELREAFFYRRVFLNARSARFDLALAGAMATLALRSPLPLLAAAPYLRLLRRYACRARPSGPPASEVAAADLVADAAGFAALVAGALRYGSPVL